MPLKPIFIAFEGLDGSGKSTLIDQLAQKLQSSAINYLLTREPGGTPLAEEIRNLLLRKADEVPHARTEVLLYQASRAQHVEIIIRPALEQNKWVLCDRFFASTVSFQCFARGLERKDIDWLNRYACEGLIPQLTVLLDLPVEESLRRMAQRNKKAGQGEDRLESERKSFHESVRQGYLVQAKESPDSWLVLDALESRETLFQNLLAELKKRKWLES